MPVSIVYCYINENNLPDHLFDSLYQNFLIHSRFQKEKSVQTFLITNRKWVNYVNNKVVKMNVECTNFTVIPSETLEKTDLFKRYNAIAKSYHTERSSFRDGFWIYTTTRFLYISAFMEEFSIERVFHIESDVMIYENLNKTLENLKKLNLHSKIVAVQDAPNRAVCSLVYLPTIDSAKRYSEYIVNTIEQIAKMGMQPINDMDLMGMYTDKFHFPDSPYHDLASKLGVYDANGIGQYLGGIDFRNIPESEVRNKFVNPTRGFINETATFKPNTAVYRKAKMNGNLSYNGKKFFIGKKNTQTSDQDLIVIHVHSKQLYLFSSVFDINYLDLITGDRVISICDFVLVDYSQFNYNRNLMKHNQNVILVKDFSNVNLEALNKFMQNFHQITGRKTIKLFVFIDIMPEFGRVILPNLDPNFKYVIYSHNGDYSFDSRFKTILEDPKVSHVFAQNLDVISDKASLLPIGIARDLFPHGNLDELYSVMVSTYTLKKTGSIYININESTHPLRREIMNIIRKNKKWNDLVVKESKKFEEYLQDLSRHRFCLCLRGNGLDTHRFWEALYLGVIPVIVWDQSLNNFINYLRKQFIPHILISDPDHFFVKNSPEYFNEALYNYTLRNKFGINASITSCDQLKLSSYLC